MVITEILGYLASVLIGLSLGLIGGGGSILTVPVLVYIFHIEPVMATAYSLFIVGLTSILGSIYKFNEKLIDLKTAFIFGLPAILAVYLTRAYLLPFIPVLLFKIGNVLITKNIFLMVLFAILMLFASVSMIRNKSAHIGDTIVNTTINYNYPWILMEGVIVGFLTGLVGAGGGFLIIPALVLLGKLSMKVAVGTSLIIIGAKSIIGFLGDLNHMTIEWPLLLSITFLAVIGFIIGNQMQRKIESSNLQSGFGWFVMAMGILILIKELFI